MSVRFCPECGTETLTGAKFCAACGVGLSAAARGRAGAQAPAPRPTLLGGLVFGGFLLVGLGIWAAILTPDPPKPRPGQVAGTPPAAPGGAPAAARELPGDVTRMVSALAERAQANPEDLDLWVHLGEVYYRTSQFDPSYGERALEAFDHVLERDADRKAAIRGKGNVYYDSNDTKKAIGFYERYLELEPGDPAVRTDLATMYLGTGERDRAFELYRAVIAERPEFMQAHYNLAAALHAEGDTDAALTELRLARRLTTDETLRKRIDALMARLSGDDSERVEAAPPPAERSPFQAIVERALRGQEIMGPRITAIEWPAPGSARVLMKSFPMADMPPMVREKFETRLRDTLRDAAKNHPVSGELSVAVIDADTGQTMTTVSP